MSLENIGLDSEMNGHEFRYRMWKYETPSFPRYYEFGKNERGEKKQKIEEINWKLRNQLK